MILKTLQLNNFLSHENTTVEFGPNDKTLLDGRSGSGKSSVIDAITWALYGKSRSDNRSLVRRGSKSTTVSVKFVDGTLETNITRTTSGAGKTTLVVVQNTGANAQFLPIERTGLKDTQDWIEKELLKASYELFTNSICYLQGSGTNFAESTASARKALLLEIVGAGSFDELYDKTNLALKTNELNNATSMVKIENLQKTIDDSTELAEKLDYFTREQIASDDELNRLTTIEKEISTKIEGFSNLARLVDEKRKNVRSVIDIITRLNEQVKKEELDILAHKAIDIDLYKKQSEEVDLLVAEHSELEKKLQDSYKAQQRLNAHLVNKPKTIDIEKETAMFYRSKEALEKDIDKCPAGDECPFIIPIKGQIEFLDNQIKERNEAFEAYRKASVDWQLEYNAIIPMKDPSELYEEQKVLSTKIKVLLPSKDVIKKYNEFEEYMRTNQSRIDEMKITILNYENDRNRLQVELFQADKDLADTNIGDLNVNLDIAAQGVKEASSRAQYMRLQVSLAINARKAVEDASSWLKLSLAGLKKAQSEKESLLLLKEALSSRGIKAVVVDYLLPQLEERINSTLCQLSDFRIRLDTQKSTADEEGIKEGLFITVLNDRGDEMPFSNYSGGEKVKITISIAEALASLMNKIDFRIMDENIVSLDKDSTENFISVLSKLQQKFPQLLVISHLQEVKDIFSKQIVISKVNGISKIV